MNDDELGRRLADCVDTYHRRRDRGETPDLRDFLDQPDAVLSDLAAVLDAEAAFDDVIEPRSGARFPRPFGEHTLVSELGRGAIGMVYEAKHRASGRRVALKVLRTGLDGDPASRQRFRREAAACAAVKHPNIVAIHDVGEQDGEAWYSMELVPGPTLHAAGRAGTLPAGRDLAGRFAELADALHALHAAGIIHRDVKPANVVVAADGRFVLADFGLARAATVATTDRLTSPGDVVGTPLYMSPEQVDGGGLAADGRADVYSLGATMYEVLAGRPMFEASDPVTLLRRVLDERPAPLGEIAPAVDRGFRDVVMKCVEKRRDDRYETAADLRDDLLAVAAGRGPDGRPVTATTHRLRRAKRWVPLAAVVFTAAAGIAWWSAHRPASLLVRSVPPGELFVDGAPRGTTPVRLELAPGRHEIALRLAGFTARPESIDLAPGEVRDVRHALVAADPDDPEAIRRLAEAVDVAFASFSDPSPLRGTTGGGRAVPLSPRGIVTATETATLRIECDEDFVGGGTIRFRRGDETLHEEPFASKRLDVEIPMPTAVATALRPGDRIEWGWVPPTGAPSLCQFVVADAASADDAKLAARLADIDACLADQPAAARRQIRALALLDANLPARAYAEAVGVVTERPGCVNAWKLMRESLVRAGLGETRLAVRAQRGLDRAIEAPPR